MLLSILICTIPQRREFLRRLCEILYVGSLPYKDDVEIIIAEDDCIMSVGEKRNKLIEAAKGDYVVFIDDDDRVPLFYIDTLLPILKENKYDCIGFNFIFNYKGHANPSPGIASLKCKHWICDKAAMTRPISHINPMRRSIAASVKFPLQNRGEDALWAAEIAKKLSNEYYIDAYMYIYEAYPEYSTSSSSNFENYKGLSFVDFDMNYMNELHFVRLKL